MCVADRTKSSSVCWASATGTSPIFNVNLTNILCDHRQAGENLFVVVVAPEEVEGFNFVTSNRHRQHEGDGFTALRDNACSGAHGLQRSILPRAQLVSNPHCRALPFNVPISANRSCMFPELIWSSGVVILLPPFWWTSDGFQQRYGMTSNTRTLVLEAVTHGLEGTSIKLHVFLGLVSFVK